MRNIFFAIIAFALFLGSCEDDESINQEGLKEFTVDISGSWSIVNVSQNGNDITNLFDFQPLNLNLIYNGGIPSSYELTGGSGVPFALRSLSGELVFNDLTYPTELFFEGGHTVKFDAVDPIVSRVALLNYQLNKGAQTPMCIHLKRTKLK